MSDTIPLGTEYTAEATGVTDRAVTCAGCRHAFAYQARRTAQGTGFSVLFLFNAVARENAKRAATANLRRVLRAATDAVPCPACGAYQPDMLPLVRAGYRDGLRQAGLLVFAAGGFGVFGVALVTHDFAPWWAWVGPAIVGTGLLLARRILAARYDPNAPAGAEKRKRAGRERVGTKTTWRPPDRRYVTERVVLRLGRDGTGGILVREVTREVGSDPAA